MSERRYPKTKQAAVKLAIDTIRRGLSADRAFDSCFEMGERWNNWVAASVYRAAMDDDALMRQLPRYLDMEQAREAYDERFPMLVTDEHATAAV
ncbi:MAG: hypothetical protein IIA66_13210 [Planctomycetes bacterium]|nr:hypothetical protein [Planctomycetota bacterium]